ncbi:MAG TPA: methyltransferase domain-containing protein [Mycobacterium sp.]
MVAMTEDRPESVVRTWGNQHDYLPAAGRDFLLPGYDLLVRLLGVGRVYDELIAQADLAAVTDILEIGCGTGNVTARARRTAPAAQLTATDPDPRALARARRKVAGVHFQAAYAQRLPFADGTFDRVLSSMMLHHLDDEVKTAALREVHRVLRPGGRLHVVDVGGQAHHPEGFLARVSGHDHAKVGVRLPEFIRDAGFDCEVLGTHRLRLAGSVTFYRATRPVA